MTRATLTCLRCGWQWVPRKPGKGKPKCCPGCKQPKWDTPAWEGREGRGKKK